MSIHSRYLVELPCATRGSLARRLGSSFITNVTLDAVQSKSKAILQGLGGIELAASLGRFWTRYTRALSRAELHAFVLHYINAITSLKSAGPLLTTCLAFLQRDFALSVEVGGAPPLVASGEFAGALGAHEVALLRGAIEHADLALPRFFKDETRRGALAALARFGDRDALSFERIASLLETMPASFFSLRTARGAEQYAMAQAFLLGPTPAPGSSSGATSASEWLTRNLARTLPLPAAGRAAGSSGSTKASYGTGALFTVPFCANPANDLTCPPRILYILKSTQA